LNFFVVGGPVDGYGVVGCSVVDSTDVVVKDGNECLGDEDGNRDADGDGVDNGDSLKDGAADGNVDGDED